MAGRPHHHSSATGTLLERCCLIDFYYTVTRIIVYKISQFIQQHMTNTTTVLNNTTISYLQTHSEQPQLINNQRKLPNQPNPTPPGEYCISS